jgi:hypothetical protein
MLRILSFLIAPLLIMPLLAMPIMAEEPAKPDAHPARQTWEQHFTQANLAHDGHLTLEEANGGFASVAKHFGDIDVDHKGYVTTNDIRAWRIMRRAAHRLVHPPEDKLKPQHAYQRRYPDQRVTTRWAAAPPDDTKPMVSVATWTPRE